MTDPWKSMMTALVQDYDKLYGILNNPTRISVSLEKKDRYYWIKISEDWSEDPQDIRYKHSSAIPELQERIDWTISQLSTWDNVSRQSYDQWKFSRKLDAEKFITLFNLTWA